MRVVGNAWYGAYWCHEQWKVVATSFEFGNLGYFFFSFLFFFSKGVILYGFVWGGRLGSIFVFSFVFLDSNILNLRMENEVGFYNTHPMPPMSLRRLSRLRVNHASIWRMRINVSSPTLYASTDQQLLWCKMLGKYAGITFFDNKIWAYIPTYLATRESTRKYSQ